MTNQITSLTLNHEAPDYYYTKKSQSFIDLGAVPNGSQLPALTAFCVENKNPLNLATPGTADLMYNVKKLPADYYCWPIPFCFSWTEYRESALEGITPLRLADQFWDTLPSILNDPDHPEGFAILSAEIRLLPPGSFTYRFNSNPGGPQGKFWYSGGSCRLMVVLQSAPGAKWVSGFLGSETTLEPVANQVYEFNNSIPFSYKNDSDQDFIFIQVDLVPLNNAVEAEQRILADETFGQLHVKFASGFPVHPTLHL